MAEKGKGKEKLGDKEEETSSSSLEEGPAWSSVLCLLEQLVKQGTTSGGADGEASGG